MPQLQEKRFPPPASRLLPPESQSRILTVHNEHDALADCWRYAIGGDAQIGAHIQPIHLGNGQEWAIICDGCKDREANRNKTRLIELSSIFSLL